MLLVSNIFRFDFVIQMYLVLVTVTIAGYMKDWRTELLNGGTSGELLASSKEKWTIFRVIQYY
jgi:hypothetical protein